MKNTLCAALFSVVLAGPAVASQPPAPAGEFVPATPGASTEQLPAAPLLIAAYAFVWVAAMGYVWTIARRLNKVETELRALEQKATRTSR
jgi:CcmD family protein